MGKGLSSCYRKPAGPALQRQCSLLVDGVAGGEGPQRLVGQREHKDVLVLGGAHGMVPQLLVLVRARVGAARVKVRDVGRGVLVVEEALRACLHP